MDSGEEKAVYRAFAVGPALLFLVGLGFTINIVLFSLTHPEDRWLGATMAVAFGFMSLYLFDLLARKYVLLDNVVIVSHFLLPIKKAYNLSNAIEMVQTSEWKSGIRTTYIQFDDGRILKIFDFGTKSFELLRKIQKRLPASCKAPSGIGSFWT